MQTKIISSMKFVPVCLLLCVAFLISSQLFAQCLVNQLTINTGYNPATNSTYANGVQDQYWSVTYNSPSNQAVAPATPPYQAYTITPNPAWTSNAASRWICFLSNPNYSTANVSDSTYQNNYTRYFKNCFADTFTFDVQWAADNWLSSFIVDGITYFTQGVQSSFSQFGTFHAISPFSVYLTPGTHEIDAIVFNYPVGGVNPTGLNIVGTVTGTYASLLSDTCPAVTSISVAPNLDTICVDSSVTLTASGAGAYTWSPALGLNTTTGPIVIASPPVTTTYYVSANACNGTLTDSVTVQVIPFYSLNAGPDTTTCVHNSLQLNAVVGAPPGAYTITWSPATYLNNSTITDPLVQNPQNNINYIATVTHKVGNVSCLTIDTLKVQVLQGFTIFNHDTTVCFGSTVQVNGLGDPRYTYTWSPLTWVSNPAILTPSIKPDSSTDYFVTASYPGCNDSSNHFKISIEPVPVVIAGPNREVCSGDTLHLRAQVTPHFNYSYSWTPASSLSDPDKLGTIFTASGKGISTLIFTVTTPVAKCSGTDSLHINTVKRFFLDMLSHDTAICPLDTMQLHVTVDSDALTGLLWSSNERYINTPNSTDPYVCPVSSARYFVYGVDSAGCHDTLSVFIEVNPMALINLPDTITIYPGDVYKMDPQTNCSDFKWFPPVGLSADSISNPLAQPSVNTRYIVTGRTEAGCSTVDSVYVLVAPDSRIDVPNIFTPGSGPNAVLKVLHIGSATLGSFSIFNRWGQKVFETKDITQGWDGTFNGVPQPVGVYVFVVEAYTFKGNKFYKQGNVTLLR